MAGHEVVPILLLEGQVLVFTAEQWVKRLVALLPSALTVAFEANEHRAAAREVETAGGWVKLRWERWHASVEGWVQASDVELASRPRPWCGRLRRA